MWRKAKERAAASGVAFTITPADIEAVWPVEERCPALGVTLERGRGKQQNVSPSLDRLNNAWGYEPGNIAVISNRANSIKRDASATELEQVATWMRKQGLS